jgi:Fe-S-cluster-containing dehydrogenase component
MQEDTTDHQSNADMVSCGKKKFNIIHRNCIICNNCNKKCMQVNEENNEERIDNRVQEMQHEQLQNDTTDHQSNMVG